MRRDEPLERDIKRIENWKGDWIALLKFMESIWPSYGVVRKRRAHNVTMWEFVTGGWSGCEQIIDAFYSNYLAKSLLWESAHRGGLHVLMYPMEGLGVDMEGVDDDTK
jgi:hypothetical protein